MTALKAYSVQDEENGVVVFAANNAAARREGGDELGGGWESIETCRRAPEFDEFAPGPVPAQALLEAGWWQECSGCGRMVREDDGGDDEDGDDDGDFFSRVPAFRGKSVYCCARCMAVDDAEHRMRAQRDAALIELVVSKYPETILVDHVYSGHQLFERGREANWQVYFRLPGLEGSVHWTSKDPEHCYVRQSDEATFRERYGAKGAN